MIISRATESMRPCPPLNDACLVAPPLGQHREDLVDARDALLQPCRLAPQGPAADLQVLFDGEQREGVQFLRHVAHAAAA